MNLLTERCVELMRELTPVIDKALRSTRLYVVPPFLRDDERASTMPVFVGGSIVGLLVTDPNVHTLSPTKDIDLVLQVRNRMDFCHVEVALRQAGFRDVIDEQRTMIGRFTWGPGNETVEFLPPVPEITGFSDQWYSEVLNSAQRTHGVWHASAPAYLATKINSFLDGRRGNFASSKDIEDILAVLDGRVGTGSEIENSQPELREWLKEKLRYFLGDADFLNALPGHLPDIARAQRAIGRLREIVA